MNFLVELDVHPKQANNLTGIMITTKVDVIATTVKIIQHEKVVFELASLKKL